VPSIHVVPEDLHVSAAKVDLHADELQLRHTSANGEIEGAQLGLPAAAAVALSAAVAKWQADTSVLFARIARHGEALRDAAAGYMGTDEGNAEDIETVGDLVSSLDFGL
jgi:uncharacterized protein YukE